jgi:hypothetical protein
VRTFMPGAPPIGRRFRLASSSSTSPERLYEIVGLVADAKYRRLRDTPMPVAFVAIVQRGGNATGGQYVVRTAAELQAFTPALRDALARVHPNLRFVARSYAIVSSVLRESGLLIAIGLALGVALSLAMTGAASTLLFGLEPRDAATIAAAVGGLALVALAASLLPAQRAARVDPMSTLKEE